MARCGIEELSFVKLFAPLISVANSIEDATSAPSQDSDRSLTSASEVVTWLHTPKQPKFWLLIWIATLASLGLHALLLLVPMPDEPEPAPAKPEERQVRITQLPTLTRPAPNRAPVARSTPRPASPRPQPVRRSTTIPPLVRPPIALPVQPVPSQPQANQATTPEPVAAADANPWQDFPQYPGAQAGCYNLQSCLQTGRALSEVSSFFERELTSKRYTATATISESDRKVYQVTRNNLTQYLSLINVPGQGTLYVLAEAPRTLTDLGGAIEVPAEISTILSGLPGGTNPTRSEFAQPDKFFQGDTQNPEIGLMQTVTGEVPDTFFDGYLRTNLVNSGYEAIELSQSYGGGLLYEVKKEDTSLYVNVVPTADGSGTIVVIWRTLPQ